jgi:parallel beta-helix repeat protein
VRIAPNTPRGFRALKLMVVLVLVALAAGLTGSSASAVGLVVDQATDDGTGNVNGSLSFAIEQANASTGETITFASGLSTVTETASLPAITKPTTISGANVTLDGSGATAGANGITLGPGSGGSEIDGLTVTGFTRSNTSGGNGILVQSSGDTLSDVTVTSNGGYGIYLSDVSNTRVKGNTVGGSGSAGNGFGGVRIDGNSGGNATGNVIGGSTPADGNTILNNANNQIYMEGSTSASQANHNTIEHNTITNSPSSSANGVAIIGNLNVISNNAISGTAGPAIVIRTDSSGNTISHNSLTVTGFPQIKQEAGSSNDGQVPPILESVDAGGNVVADAPVATGHSFTTEFFASAACDQAAQFLEADTFNSGQQRTIALNLPSGLDKVTATATDDTTHDTSTLSNAVDPAQDCGAPPAMHADLSTDISAPATVAAGNSVTYDASVSNAGPANSGFTLTVTLDSSETFVSAPAGCSNASGTVTCTGTQTAGAAAAHFSIVASTPSSQAAGATLSTSSSVAANAPVTDPIAGNDGPKTATTTVTNQADLSVTVANHVSTSPVIAGSPAQGSFSTQATVSNGGPSDSHGYKVTYSLGTSGGGQAPTDVAFASPGGSGCVYGATHQIVVCTEQTSLTPPSGSNTSEVAPQQTVVASSAALGDYTVTAAVLPISPVTDPDTSGASQDSDVATTNVTAQADLSVTGVSSTPTNAPVVAGGPVAASGSFSVQATVSNGGPSDSHGYKVTYALATTGGSGQTLTDVGFVSLPTGCSLTAAGVDDSVDCSRSTSLSGSSHGSEAAQSLTVQAASSALGGYTVTATVSPSAAVTQPPGNDPNQDRASATQNVTAQADLKVTGVVSTPSSAPVVAGGHAPGSGSFTTQATVANAGPSDSHGYKVTYALGTTGASGQTLADVGFVSLPTGCSFTTAGLDDSVDCTKSTSLSGSAHQSETAQTLEVDAASSALGDYTVTATVSPSAPVTQPSGNDPNQDHASAATAVVARANLSVTKSGSSFNNNYLVSGTESANLVYANLDATKNVVTYTITITALGGPSDARNVTITDDVNAGITPSPNVTSAFSARICGLNIPTEGTTGCAPLTTAGVNVGTMKPTDSRTYTITSTASDSLRSGGYLVGGTTPNLIGNVVTLTSTTPDVHTLSPINKQAASGRRAFIATRPDAPTNVAAFAGNGNAGVTWSSSLHDGGQPLTYHITATSGSTVITRDLDPNTVGSNGFNLGPNNTFQYLLAPLTNGLTYTITVRADNTVGSSGLSNTATTLPSVNNSAFVFTNGGTQQTAPVPSTTDPQVESQTFNTGTSGLGTIQECATTGSNSCNLTNGAIANATLAGAANKKNTTIIPTTFCGGAQCIGAVVITKLSNPANGRYTVILQYAKQIISGTGTSFKVYFENPATQTSPTVIPDCPNKGTPTVPACVVKIVSQPASNPALKVQLSVAPGVFDPVIGTRK